MVQSIKPLALPKLSRGFADLSNALRRAALPAAFSLGRERPGLSLAAEPLRFAPAAVVAATVNGERWEIALSSLEWVASHPLFADPSLTETKLEDLPAELKEALVETLLEPVFAAASDALGLPVRFESVEIGGRMKAEPAAGFAVSDPAAARAPLWVSAGAARPEAIASACAALRKLPAGPARAELVSALPLSLHFSAGSLGLTASEFEAVRVGDVLLPQGAAHPLERLTVTLQSAGKTWLSASCSLSGRTATLEQPAAPAVAENRMQDAKNIEVTLAFELEERPITLGELSQLKPGSVFTLAADPQSPVRILANGKPVAQGRLVDVNGQLGVQVTAES